MVSPFCCLARAVLLPGHFALELSPAGGIRRAQACPQRYWCPGGSPSSAFDPSRPEALPANETTIRLCVNGTWTMSLGATAAESCSELNWSPPRWYQRNALAQPHEDVWRPCTSPTHHRAVYAVSLLCMNVSLQSSREERGGMLTHLLAKLHAS